MKNLFLFVMLICCTHCLLAQAAYEKTIFQYSSSDGTTFSNGILFQDSADVPSISMDSSGRLIGVFQWFHGQQGSATWDKIGVKISSDNGANWTTAVAANINAYPGSRGRPFDPTITRTAEGDLRMYFSSCAFGTMGLDSTCGTYSATGTDGINFTFDPGERFGVSSREVIDPTVVYFGGTYHYTAPSGPPQAGAYHATSPDGLNFTLIDTTSSDNFHNWTGNLMDNGADFRFYGSSNPLSQKLWWVGTSDGNSWTTFNHTNIEGKDPAVYKLGASNYLMITPIDTTIVLSTSSEETANVMEVYPVPAREEVIFRCNADVGETGNLLVFDLAGQLMTAQKMSTGDEFQINGQILSPGIYFYRYETENGALLVEGKFVID